jgi:hypothetical protein
MAIDVWLTDEGGTPHKEVADDKGDLARVIARASGESYPLLSGIDPYADTVFNSLQMRVFIPEWDRLAGHATSPREIDLMARVRDLATTVQKDAHAYLKFVGD